MSSRVPSASVLAATLLALVASASAQPAVPPPVPPADPVPAAPPAEVPPAEGTLPADAAAPPVDVAPPVTPEVMPPPEPAPVPWIVRGGTTYFGVELGVGSAADSTNAFDPTGLGKALVLRIRTIEMRFEAYDLEMRAPELANAGFAKGRFTATSVGKRFALGGRFAAVRLLAAGAYVRRPSISANPDDVSSEVIMRHQHGLAAVLGAGVQLLRYVTIEARVYPTLWTDNSGDVRAGYLDGQPAVETLMEKVGGMPMTLTAGVGVSW